MKKIFLFTIIILLTPIIVIAVNDVSLNGVVDFQINTIDTVPASVTVFGQNGGVVSQLDVGDDYIDITLDAGSDITFNTTGNYFNLALTPPAGVTQTPVCPLDQVRLQATANAVVRLEVSADYPLCLSLGGGGGSTAVFPSDTSIVINNNDECTDSVDVSLNLTANNAKQVLISNNNHFQGADWEEFTSPMMKDWQLESGDGEKAVYVLYKSNTNSLSTKISDTIELKSIGCNGVGGEEDEEGEEEIIDSIEGLDFGDLIKGSLATVYFYGADNNRYSFPNENTYFTWYEDFSGVKTVSDEILASLPLVGNVTYKPGVKMLKLQSIPKVYAVDLYGVLRWIATEELAQSLYGDDWALLVDDLNDAFYFDYEIGDEIDELTDYNPSIASSGAENINVDKKLIEL